MGLKYCISRQKISFWNISWKWQVCYHPRKKLSSSCEKDNPQENNTYNLTLSWRRPLSYRNQSIDLLCKSMGWFLYDNGLRYERVKEWYLSCLKEHVGNIVWDREKKKIEKEMHFSLPEMLILKNTCSFLLQSKKFVNSNF